MRVGLGGPGCRKVVHCASQHGIPDDPGELPSCPQVGEGFPKVALGAPRSGPNMTNDGRSGPSFRRVRPLRTNIGQRRPILVDIMWIWGQVWPRFANTLPRLAGNGQISRPPGQLSSTSRTPDPQHFWSEFWDMRRVAYTTSGQLGDLCRTALHGVSLTHAAQSAPRRASSPGWRRTARAPCAWRPGAPPRCCAGPTSRAAAPTSRPSPGCRCR